MKLLICFWPVILAIPAQAQDSPDSNYDKRIEAYLIKRTANTATDEDKKDLKKIAFDLQNRGQILEEAKHDYKGSLELVNKAINVFNYLNDTLNVANNLKFKGYLLARFGKFTQGKNEISQAIALFTLKNKDWGIAVSNYDLSRVYELENKFDSAIYYCNLSLNHWKQKNTPARNFNNQNMLINLMVKTNQLLQAKALQIESEKASNNPKLHWQDLIDFYYVSNLLYIATAEPLFWNEYQALYINKIGALKQAGIAGRSYFENLP